MKIERVSDLSEKFYAIEEVNYEAEVEKILIGLGFVREDFTRQTTEFSEDGECELSWLKSFAKPDLILLDEPTNHMDIESIQWLEDFLINSKAVVVILTGHLLIILQIVPLKLLWGVSMIIKPNILII
jgi:ATP-binding cassette subfamily F protein 3